MTYAATPVTRLSKAVTGGYDIYIKRDDLLPFSFGGNKVRIADAFLADMEEKGCDSLIFYGDRRSNLCRVLANRCFIGKIPAIMIATEEHSSEDSSEPYNSRLIRECGIPVIDCKKDAIAEAVDEAFSRLRGKGLKPYYIYGDRYGRGNEGTAASAYAKAYGEIRSFEENEDLTFDLIAVPYGTGATMSGLICGAIADESRPKGFFSGRAGDRILGLSISSRTKERAASLLEEAIEGHCKLADKPLPADYREYIHLETSYNLGGYGLYDDRVTDMIGRMLKENGIPMDPTYTGKAFLALTDWLKDREAAGETLTDKKILFLHTGGLPLFFDYLAEGK